MPQLRTLPAPLEQPHPPAVSLGRPSLEAAKLAYSTRHVRLEAVRGIRADVVPGAGDLVLAVVTEVGQHKRLELRDGRRAALFPGDEIVVCYGSRYAPDQFEAEVPPRIERCALVAAGGVAGRMITAHDRVAEPTQIKPLGVLTQENGRPVNLRDWALPATEASRPAPPTIAVLGTSMNSGKTTAAAHLVRGLSAAGTRPGAAKVTGTGAGGDVWLLQDAGATPVLDFTSAGHVSTYGVAPAEIERVMFTLHGHVAAARCDVVVLEVADGLFQQETRALTESEGFADTVDGVLFAACDALGAALGVDRLRHLGLTVLGVTGMVTASPLAAREAAAGTGVPVLGLEALEDPKAAAQLLADLSDDGQTTTETREQSLRR